MPLTGTINQQKDLALTYQPVLLCEFAMFGGTASFNAASRSGITFDGRTYQARVVNQNIAAIQAMSSQGIDEIPEVTIIMADDDAGVYSFENQYGSRARRSPCG
jgi:hypothetical protein